MPFEENVTVDEGINKQGVRTQLHFEGDSLIVQRTYDAEPHLQYAKAAREATAGQRWGEGQYVGHLPPAEYAKILLIRDKEERRRAVRRFFEQNRDYVMFERALIVPQTYRARAERQIEPQNIPEIVPAAADPVPAVEASA